MKHLSHILTLVLAAMFAANMTSCRSYVPAYDYRELAKASIKLGVDIDKKDNHELYLESARWIGTPYRYGQSTIRKGTDCSGFTKEIYRKVYGINISRSSAAQRRNDCTRVRKRKLKEGDLVFFTSDGRRRSKINHVGIYLKDGKFVHASTSKGVTVDKLKDPYYAKRWHSGGRVK